MSSRVARLNHRIEDDRAWTRASVCERQPWLMRVPQSCAELTTELIESWRCNPKTVTDIRLDESQRCIGKKALAPVRRELESGCGFVILDRISVDEQSLEEAKLTYWLIGQMLGEPWAHHSLLSDVLNPGPNLVVDEGVTFHTDASFLETPPDYIGLLCLRPARAGGQSRMLSAYSLHQALTDRYPQTIETLYQPFCFDRRGVFKDGEATTFDFPVFTWNGQELSIRYFNQDIHLGHRNADRPMSPAQNEALEAVEDLLEDDNLFVEFTLEPGQVLWANNRCALHKRNVYHDHEDMNRRRHFVRLYLSR